MEYRGTSGADTIDQKALNIADFSNIFGGAGDDILPPTPATWSAKRATTR